MLAIIAHFVSGDSNVGESVNLATISEIIGFLICILGALIYNSILKIPCITYIQPEDTEPLEPSANASPENNENEKAPTNHVKHTSDKEEANENEMELQPL